MNEKNGWNDSNLQIQNKYREFEEIKNKINPKKIALQVIISYLVLGCLWILLSDKILAALVPNDDMFQAIQLYKGWFYVFVTGAIFFVYLYHLFQKYKEAVDSVLLSYEDLNAAYEEMIAMNEELDKQNEVLIEQKKALTLSEQRYELVIQGSSDGIWDWDLEHNYYLVTTERKMKLGYEEDELGNTIEDWAAIMYPGEWEQVEKDIRTYLEQKTGIYESLFRLRKKDGEYCWIVSRGKAVWDEQGKPLRMAGSHTDITERIVLEKKLEALAYYDILTGLPNRIFYEKRISELLANQKSGYIMNLDIDDLKHVNDVYGQEIGDGLIKHIADILKQEINAPHFAARLSGDQFSATFVGSEFDIQSKMNILFQRFHEQFEIAEEHIVPTVSVGIAMFPAHGNSFVKLLQNSEIAMFHQKEKGKDGYLSFIPDMYEETVRLIQINKQLRLAVEREEFVLYYQPQYLLATGELVGAEALIRWNHPERGIVSPMEFIPLAEKTGHIYAISLWVLKEAITQKREWEKNGFTPLKIAVNMSGHVIVDEDGIRDICHLIEEMKVLDGEIEIEVTETALMMDLDKANIALQRLREYGITISMDDFGTGYSSLTYLHQLPFDYLKIDREFIRNITDQNDDDFIYRTVIELAHNLGLSIVAEGVETTEQNEFLLKNNCDIGQGYLYAKPLPPKEFEKLFIK